MNDIKNIPIRSKDNDGSPLPRHSLSREKKSPLSRNLQRRLKEKNWGIPLTVISKTGTVKQKSGITNKNKEGEERGHYKSSTKIMLQK